MIMKPAFLISLFVIACGTAFASSCPTCPKSYAASRLEEVLIAQQKNKGLTSKKKLYTYTPTPNLAQMNSLKKTPTHFIRNRPEQLNKAISSVKPQHISPDDILADKVKTRNLLHPPTQGLADIVRNELTQQKAYSIYKESSRTAEISIFPR
jgi:hypothetical protein